MFLDPRKLATTPTILATLGIAAVLLLAALPTSNATHFGTGGADVRLDATITGPVYYQGAFLGNVSPLTFPGGFALRTNTAYELTVNNFTQPNGTQVEIISPNGTVRVSATPYTTGYDGPGACAGGVSPGCLKNATFLIPSSAFASAGVYRFRELGTGEIKGAIYVGPTAISLTMSPNPVTISQPGSMYVLRYTTLPGANLSGPGLSGSATTDPTGNYTTIHSHGPGTFTANATKQSSNETTNGVDVPEFEGSGTYSVVLSTPRVSIGNVSGSILHAVSTPIRLENVSDFGSATVKLAFDPDVVEVLNVTNSSIPNASLTWDVNESAGTMTLLVTTSARPGVSGSFNLAMVQMRAVGAAGSNSTLDLTIQELVDSDGDAITATTSDGSFRAGLLGDADGDGDVDLNDVIAISDVVVGKAPLSSIVAVDADVSRDGVVTGKDAMFLSQHLAGTRPTL